MMFALTQRSPSARRELASGWREPDWDTWRMDWTPDRMLVVPKVWPTRSTLLRDRRNDAQLDDDSRRPTYSSSAATTSDVLSKSMNVGPAPSNRALCCC